MLFDCFDKFSIRGNYRAGARARVGVYEELDVSMCVAVIVCVCVSANM